MTERPKVHDWKSCVPPKGTVGSNPTLSASYNKARLCAGFIVTDEKNRDKNPRGEWVRLPAQGGRRTPVDKRQCAPVRLSVSENQFRDL